MNHFIDKKIKEELSKNLITLPSDLDSKIHKTIASLPTKKKRRIECYLLPIAVSLCLLILSVFNVPTFANIFPILTSLEKFVHIGGNYEKISDNTFFSSSVNGDKLTITNTIFDGFQLMVSYKLESNKPLNEKPSMNTDKTTLSGKGVDGKPDEQREYGEFTDKLHKKYNGVILFTLKSGNFTSDFNSNGRIDLGEKMLNDQQINVNHIPDKFSLNLELKNIHEEASDSDWSMTIPITSEKAKGNVKEININKNISAIPGTKVEKIILTPIRLYIQSIVNEDSAFLDYLVVDDQGKSLTWLGGQSAGHYKGKQRVLSYYANDDVNLKNLTLIPFKLNKSVNENQSNAQSIELNSNRKTIIPLDSKRNITITKALEKDGKTYLYYESPYPINHYLPFVLIDKNQKVLIRDLEESISASKENQSVLVYNQPLLNKDIKVQNVNTIYYDKAYKVTLSTK
ncbi:DUF4179 domain-containing protein [Falsibacillus pallidus]|uniref:Uncharacterized protein DUF4179 n=1 Tax=Falsibacillus pallidus TaxID=493781 RepID=A0A370GPU3_9BACI|nr:DUF4179 domain-containing protein [Falsibacillus pallidus]RDI45735.1 uncharacterized protein DUF4179 [Falsibacillus pallidus]